MHHGCTNLVLSKLVLLVVAIMWKEGVCEVIANSSQTSTETGLKPELYLLALAPYPDPGAPDNLKPLWDYGHALIPAARLAVELVNNRSDILSGYTVALIAGDSGCSELTTKGLFTYFQGVFYSGKRVLGVVGPACSSVAVQIGPLVVPERVAMVQVTIATSPTLTDRDKYPYTFLTIGSSKQFATVFLELMRINSWDRFGVLYDGLSTFHRDTLTSFSEELQLRNMTGALQYNSAIYHTYFPLQQMKDTHLRVFVILTGPRLARKLMCLALYNRNLFPTYQWIFIETTLEELNETTSFSYEQQDYSCSEHEVTYALEGSILLLYKLKTNRPDDPTVSGLTYSEYEELYRRKVEEYKIELNSSIPNQSYANAYYDAVWAVALALNASILPLNRTGVSLSDYQPGRSNITEVIRQQLIEVVDFNGVSGKITFDISTGQTLRSIDLFQVHGHQLCSIGVFSPNKTSAFDTNGSYIQDSFKTENAQISTSTFAVFLAISVLQLVAVAFVHAVNIYYRNYKSIKASSPCLNHLMFLGSYLLVVVLIELLVLGFSPPSGHTFGGILCSSVLCFAHPGMSLILTTICVKLWRIYRIFVHSWKPGGYLYNRVLVVTVVLLILPVVIYCLVRISTNPLTLSSTETFQDYKGLPYIEVTVTCQYIWYDTVVLRLWEAILLGSALCLSILTRHVNQKFRTTRSTTALIYSLVLISCIGIPLYLMALLLSWDLDITYSIQYLMYNSVLFVCLLFGFVPPLIPLIREKLCH